MSLFNRYSHFSIKDYFFVAAGLLGFFCFFMTYSSQDPRSMVDTTRGRESMIAEARGWANVLGFNSDDFEIEADVEFDISLMDSLQAGLGREEAIARFSGNGVPNLYPWYWEASLVSDEPRGGEAAGAQDPSGPGPESADLIVRISPRGEWIGLLNDDMLFPAARSNREALQAVFSTGRLEEVWETIPDTSLGDAFRFDMDRGYNTNNGTEAGAAAPGVTSPIPATRVDSTGEEEPAPYYYTRDELLRLAAYFIDRSGWVLEQFEVADIQLETIRSAGVAHVEYRGQTPILDRDLSLRVSVTSSGMLLDLRENYDDNASVPGTGGPNLWELMSVVVFFLFGVGAIVIFYTRIRARVIDTRSALIMSILAGFLVPVMIFLDELGNLDLLGGDLDWLELFGQALIMGISGAFSAVVFFVISAIGDSVTRQYQEDKLEYYDYLRQGLFFNKPVGETLVRSVILAGMLSGLWSAALMLFPNLYMEIDEVFRAYEVFWSPVHLILENFLYSLIVIMGVFLVLGSQVYAVTRNRLFSGAATTLAIALISPLSFSMGPLGQQFLLYLILGFFLTLIFVKWDFLTLFLSFFLLSSLLAASGGWMVPGSPDVWTFVVFGILLLFAVAAGTLSMVKGQDEQALPDYIPDYVEELAQEERIKQELKIARDVQQSFLPVRTPTLKGLELAAICKPAYETGGDYYDFIPLDDHRIAVAIGDVSGKGIQAAFYMTFIKGILHGLCYETSSPAELLKKANRLFFDNARRGTFISLVYGIIDTREGTFRFARAGHNPILHIRKSDGNMELLRPNGLGLGLTVDSRFDENIQERTLHLEHGDILVLYTDGIVESMNSAHLLYGTDRLKEKLKKTGVKRAGQILTGLFEDIANFTGSARQNDDMTAMVVRFTGPGLNRPISRAAREKTK